MAGDVSGIVIGRCMKTIGGRVNCVFYELLSYIFSKPSFCMFPVIFRKTIVIFSLNWF